VKREALPTSNKRFTFQTKRTITIILSIAFTVMIVAAWSASYSYTNNRKSQLIAGERINTENQAEVLSTIIDHELSHIINIPEIIACDPETSLLLERFGTDVKPSSLAYEDRHKLWNEDLELSNFGKKLTLIVNIKNSGVNTCWLMNAAADTVAIGKLENEINFTGANYADREYFKSVKSGKNGYQFAVGRFSNVPALYFVSPVMNSGKFLGAVGARSNLKRLDYLLSPNVFLSDEYGVIIWPYDPNLYMHALPNNRISELDATGLVGRYKTKEIPILSISKAIDSSGQEIFSWKDGFPPGVYSFRSCLNNNLTIHVFSRLKGINDIDNDRFKIFIIASITGMLFLISVTICLYFFINNRQHRLELIEVNEQLHHIARIDTLTGCANRRYFFEELTRERHLNVRYGNLFCIMSIDIDYFKNINDRFGHPTGDKTLLHFVSVVKTMLRQNDLLGRMGGEEFCILLPQTRIDDASKVAERIRAAVENSPLTTEQAVIHLTVSIGVSSWKPDVDKTEDDILSRTDNLMYTAKESGRNKVIVDSFS
jgi:diguanylate cyclase (GGDEF)-like protein